jgi:hypothetical protein
MVPSPSPQTFTTFTTFAMFAKFANFDSAGEHPPLMHRHTPRPGSISERAVPTPLPPLPAHRERVGVRVLEAGRG